MSHHDSDTRGRRNSNNGPLPSLRAARQNQAAEEDGGSSREELTSALLPVLEPGDDSLRPVLLEPGLPILPSDGQAAGRRQAARNAELQVPGYAGNGNYGDQPRTETLPPACFAEVDSSPQPS